MGVFEKAVICGEEVEQYIPQRHPVVMISGFHGMEEERFFTSLDICSNNIFCHNGALSEAGIIEHIAQSCAFRNGYIARSGSKPVSLGYIGSLSNFKFYNLPAVGSRICTTLRVEYEFDGISLVGAQTRCGDRVVAEGKLKVALIKRED